MVRSRGEATVLVVDDEEGPREALSLVLEPYFRVVRAANGEEALEILRREPIDAVTLDLRMPGLDGVGTLERIRAFAPDLPVVVITAFGSKETLADTLFLGVFSYLNKPFHASQLVETVRAALESRIPHRSPLPR